MNVSEDSIWEFDSATCSIPAALAQLAKAVGASWVLPYPKTTTPSPAGAASPAQSDALTARSLCAAIARLQPEGAIVVDESLTSGTAYWALSQVPMALHPPSLLGQQPFSRDRLETV